MTSPSPSKTIPEQREEGLRDRFAMAALTGILACFRDYRGSSTTEGRAVLAYQYADAMMKARAN